MSLQWEIIAVFLYVEIILLLVLISPLAPPVTWSRVFKSKVLKALVDQSFKYCAFIMFVIVICFCDALRETRKYSELHKKDENNAHLDVEMQVDMRLFRAQRNMYVSGFALVLIPVLSQVISLLRKHGELLETRSNADDAAPATDLQQKLKQLETELSREKKDSAAVRSQCDSVKREYDRLSREHAELQNTVNGLDKSKDD